MTDASLPADRIAGIRQPETAAEIIQRVRRLSNPFQLEHRGLDQELVRIELERLLARLRPHPLEEGTELPAIALVDCPECGMPARVWCMDPPGKHRDWPDSHGARWRQLDPVAALEDAERDVPREIRDELLRCATDNGRISYHWLCRLYKRGIAAARLRPQEVQQRPRIVCLCGSTRFIDAFAVLTWVLERQRGVIVLGCTLLPDWYCTVPSHFGEATGTKEQCDEHHKRKIDLADEVLIIDIGGYIGESTRSEIEYATATGKPISYLRQQPELLAALLAGRPQEVHSPNAGA